MSGHVAVRDRARFRPRFLWLAVLPLYVLPILVEIRMGHEEKENSRS